MRKPAAIYARVSSDRQKENHTIASQTAALIQHAETQGYAVPSEWVFQDEGYSGASLVRPGLEAVRDLAAQGHIEAVLVHSPDRLSRKYAYQVLLAEEFNRQGVELVFLKAPTSATPEDQLVVQFQGMIAEYERAQIIERSRRGKRHRAQQGTINVLSGAPYGYRYVKKSDSATAYYEVIEAEADVVRLVFDTYTKEGLSINAIARLLNDRRTQPAGDRRGGNGLRYGPCCAILHTKAKHALAKRSARRVGRSRGPCGSEVDTVAVVARIESDRAQNGSRLPYRRW